MCTLITRIGGERDTKHPKAKNIARPNRCRIMITKLRKELKALKQQYKKATEKKRPALTELRDILQKRLISIWHTEGHRRTNQRRVRKRAAFMYVMYPIRRRFRISYGTTTAVVA